LPTKIKALKCLNQMNYFNLYGWVDISYGPNLRHQNRNQTCGVTDIFGYTGLVTSFFPVQRTDVSMPLNTSSTGQKCLITFWPRNWKKVLDNYQTRKASESFKTTPWLQWVRKHFQKDWCQTLKNYFDFFNVRVNVIAGTQKTIWGSYVRLCSFLILQHSFKNAMSRDLSYISQTRRYGPKLLYKPNQLYRLSQKPINAFDRNYAVKFKGNQLNAVRSNYDSNQALKAFFPNQCWLFPRKFKKFLNVDCIVNRFNESSLTDQIKAKGYDIEWYQPQPFIFSQSRIHSVPINVRSMQPWTIAPCLNHGHGEIVNHFSENKMQAQRYVARTNSQNLNTVYTVNMNQQMCYPYLISKDFCFLGQFITPEIDVIKDISLRQSGQVFIATKQYTILRNAQFYRIPKTSSCTLESGQFVFRHTPLFDIRYKSIKADDIVQGIPKIERLFEARSARYTGLPQLLQAVVIDYTRKNKHLLDRKQIGLLSLRQIQIYIVNAIQIVYQSQGVNICDKHLEIVVRQMTSKVKISNPGLTGLLPDDLILIAAVNSINKYYRPPYDADFEPCVLGITKASLQTHGFLSAASFQETIRVLGSMALKKRRDYLIGLKENIILGYLLPCGVHGRITQAKLKMDVLKTIYDYDIFDQKLVKRLRLKSNWPRQKMKKGFARKQNRVYKSFTQRQLEKRRDMAKMEPLWMNLSVYHKWEQG